MTEAVFASRCPNPALLLLTGFPRDIVVRPVMQFPSFGASFRRLVIYRAS
jgi:hypothetical protein